MNVESLKEVIKRELPHLLREDPALRAYILELARDEFAGRAETQLEQTLHRKRMAYLKHQLESTEKMATTPYDKDFYSWALEQAELMRLRRFEDVDWVNVIEEIADLGRSEYRALVSALEQLTWHLLKWQYQPEKRSESWRNSIDKQRLQMERLLDENPGLKSRLEEAIASGYKYGRKGASKETRLPFNTFPEQCPYTWQQLSSDDFLPDNT